MLVHLTFSALVNGITDMGDSGVLTALVLFCSLYLAGCGCRRGAGILLCALLVAAALVSIVKLLFLGCDSARNPLHIHSPSGHAALSAAVYGAVAIIAASQLRAKLRYVPGALAALTVAAIAFSRVWLGMHTAYEVVAGLIVGCLTVTVIYYMAARNKPIQPFSIPLLITASLLAVVIFHGMRMPAEVFIHNLAQRFHAYDPLCTQKAAR